MVTIKTSLAIPSLSKSNSSRANSPATTPVASETGLKRSSTGINVLDAIPRSRSRSGEGSKRSTSVGSGPHPPAPITSTLSPTPSVSGPAHGALRPKLSALLSGRATPHATSSPAIAATPMAAGHAGTPASTPSGTIPGGPSVSVPVNGAVAISNLEASYVTKVGMSLNDAVNKVFPACSNFVAGAVSHHTSGEANVIYKGMCAPKADKAREVGQMVARELHLAINDQYLLRSLLRSAVLKSLSIFLSRLENLMVTSASDPSVLTVARTFKEAENPPLSQRYSFAILRCAWELKKGLIKACSNPTPATGKTPGQDETVPKFVKDTLAPWINKLDLLANKIFNPILATIKEEAVKTVVLQSTTHDGGLSPTTSVSSLAVPAPLSSGTRSLSLTRASTPSSASTLLGTTGATTASTPASAVPAYLRDLSALLAATNRIFAWVSVGDAELQKWKVSIGSSLIWKMLLVSSSKQVESDGHLIRRGSSPPLPTNPAVLAATNGHSHASTKRSMSSMGMSRLRGASATGKRSPSPPPSARDAHSVSAISARLLLHVEIFESILEKFVSSLLSPTPEQGAENAPPCRKGKNCPICKGRFVPLDLDDSDDEEALPREAMQEAMAALSSFIVILRAFAVEDSANIVPLLLKAISAVDDTSLAPEICPNLIRALDTLPPLILLQTLVSRIPRYYSFRMPHQLWSTTWRDYEVTMKGFHTGEEWVGEVGWELLREGRRVYKNLLAEQSSEEEVLIQGSSTVDEDGWLELLKIAIVELAEVDDLEDDGSASNVTVRSAGGSALAATQH